GPKLAARVQRAAVIAGDLVVVQVGSREAGGRDLVVHEAQAAAVDSHAFQPAAIFSGVGSGRRQHRARETEESEVVRIVAGDATPSLLQAVDKEAQVDDVGLVREDVVFESSLEAKDVVEGD